MLGHSLPDEYVEGIESAPAKRIKLDRETAAVEAVGGRIKGVAPIKAEFVINPLISFTFPLTNPGFLSIP
jgi:hypothetical protein